MFFGPLRLRFGIAPVLVFPGVGFVGGETMRTGFFLPVKKMSTFFGGGRGAVGLSVGDLFTGNFLAIPPPGNCTSCGPVSVFLSDGASIFSSNKSATSLLPSSSSFFICIPLVLAFLSASAALILAILASTGSIGFGLSASGIGGGASLFCLSSVSCACTKDLGAFLICAVESGMNRLACFLIAT